MKYLLLIAMILSISVSPLTVQEKTAVKEEIKATSPEPRQQKWWQNRHQAKLKELKKLEEVQLLWIGDSITHSWENGGKKVFAKYYAKRKPFNIGYSGDRTEHVLWRLQNGEVKGINPKLIVMMIGTNNTGHRKDKPEHTAAGIKAILGEISKRMPESRVLLLGVFPRDRKADGKMRQINNGINEIIKDFADDKKVFFLDIGEKFLAEDGTLPKSIMPDALHPNEKGYQIWAEAIELHVAKLMGEKK